MSFAFLPHMSPRAGAVGFGLCAVAMLASCTSDGGPTRSSAPSAAPTRSASSTTPAATATTSDAPADFGVIDGARLVLGSSRDRADVYAVSGGRIVRVTRSAGATAVSSGAGRTVVGVEGPGDRETVRQLRGSTLRGIGADGFDPSVSASGALVRVRVQSGSSTPGITKPGGFALVVRSSITGRDRVVLTQKQSMGSPRWIDTDRVAVAVAGDKTSLVVIDVRTGKRSDLGLVEDADDLDLAASSRTVAIATDSGGVLIDVDDRSRHPLPSGWTPLCWPDRSNVLATRSGQLATIAVNPDGSAEPPRVLGSLPGGTTAFGAGCG